MSAVNDFQNDWSGGVHGGISPKRILPNQAASAVNCRFRGGQPHARYAVSDQPLVSNDSAALPYYRSEIYQGGIYYNRPDGDYMVHVVGGRVYVLEDTGAAWRVLDVTPDGAGLARYTPLVYLCQADKYVIIQDGENVPIVVDGTTAYRAPGKNPIPIGGPMAYVNGRLWLAIANELLAGDLVGSSDDAVLKFTEALYLNEGGSFKAPNAFGNIVSLDGIAAQDTATGQGTLIVGCEYGAFSINGLVPRDQWKSVPIQQITLINIGMTSQRATCNVNGDLWFPSQDGWRTYRQARAEISGWNQVPLSAEVQAYIDNETQEFRRYLSAVYWDNRLLVTTSPTMKGNRASCRGLLSLDFHPLSTGLGQSSRPAWDGYWTLPGNVCELLSGVFEGRKRCFAVCVVGGQNKLYEFSKELTADNGTTPIQWSFTTRRYSFGPWGDPRRKRLDKGGDIRLSDEVGAWTLSLQYKPDDSGRWFYWWTTSGTGQVPVCTPMSGDCSIPCPEDHYTPRRLFGIPARAFDAISRQNAGDFYDMQCKITVTGSLTFEQLRLEASVKPAPSKHPEVSP